MTSATRLFERAFAFRGHNGRDYSVRRLTEAYARKNADALLALHNTIPYVTWDLKDLLAHRSPAGVPYASKWDVSLVVTFNDEPVGLLIAYLRDEDDRHPCRSLYIHRAAVSRQHQHNRIASVVLAYFIEESFQRLPWLLTITVQTNDEPRNRHVIDLYKGFGFKVCCSVPYPDKLDVLLELPRDEFEWNGRSLPGYRHAELPAVVSERFHANVPESSFFPSTLGVAPPTIFFQTGSREKREQYRYLLRCMGIAMAVPRRSVNVSEPQVEGSGLISEREVVTGPLKLISRFISAESDHPLMIEDTMLFIEEFNRDFDAQPLLPGPDTKRWWAALGAGGLLGAMRSSSRRRARYVCQIGVYVGPGQYPVFRSELDGEISRDIRISDDAVASFPYTNATFFHSIFIPEGMHSTLAELSAREFTVVDYRRACVRKLADGLAEMLDARASALTLF